MGSRFTLSSTLAAVLLPLGWAAAEDVPLRPFLDRQNWTFGDASAWEWQQADQTSVLVLKKASNFKPKVRSPLNLAWFTGDQWESFTLTLEVRLDKFDDGNNDVCIAFGKTGPTRFYYAHLGEAADAVHLQLHLVDDADRKAITTSGAKSLPWMPQQLHRVKLIRDAPTGTIAVWFDDVEVLNATDKTLGTGQLGLGSFDDLGSFRNLQVVRHSGP